MRRRFLWLTIGAVSIVASIAAATLVLAFYAIRYDWLHAGPGMYLEAQYDDMEFASYEADIYGGFSTSLEGPTYGETRPNARIAPVYLKSKTTGKLYYLPELTKKEFTEVTGITLKDDYRVGDSEAYLMGSDMVEFKNGKLTTFSMNPDHYRPWLFEIGPSKTGEFFALPASRATVHRIFGAPRKYRRYRGAAM